MKKAGVIIVFALQNFKTVDMCTGWLKKSKLLILAVNEIIASQT